MNVFLTFDIEVWCNGWQDLDRKFPHSFERYVFGRSAHGAYALPQTLDILNRHNLKGVFFVEPLFATRFGRQWLAAIVQIIQDAGHEIQLHLHPEWTDESREPIIDNCAQKRQHLSYYTLEEQSALIRHARNMLEEAAGGPICAFRAGSFAVNADSFAALRDNGILLDSSLNSCHVVSAPELIGPHAGETVFEFEGVTTFPVTVMQDGFGHMRPLQVGACSFAELRDALTSAQRANAAHVVIVSHNFEMLQPGSSQPDWVVVRRFERLCAFLQRHGDTFHVRGFAEDLVHSVEPRRASALPRASRLATAVRYLEQAQRRVMSRVGR